MKKKPADQRIAELEFRVKQLEESVKRLSLNSSTNTYRADDDQGLFGTMFGHLGVFL